VALTLSDRVAVFHRGRIEQVGSPNEVYERPATTFVAGFVGTSNVLLPDVAARLVGQKATFSLRPEKIRLAEPGYQPENDETVADGVVDEVSYAGASSRIVVAVTDGPRLNVVRQNSNGSTAVAAHRGDAVRLVWGRRHAVRLPEDAEAAVADIKGTEAEPETAAPGETAAEFEARRHGRHSQP
jgi:putative spermidine/putrescine transport system ATP-binding protein